MAAQRIGMPSGSISMSSRTADKLISLGSGDAALLFLHLLRTGGLYDIYTASKTLGWEERRITAAFAELENLELVKGTLVETTPVASSKDAPEYSSSDISQELTNPTSQFGLILQEVERALGKTLSYQDTARLMELYDHLALPPEVIFLLVNHVVEDTEARYGANRRPKMAEIKREGYQWASKGLDTLEAADAYLKKVKYFRSMEGEILTAVGVRDRQATAQERRYINAWLDMGFPVDTIVMACEKTMLNIGQFKWAYCNGILQSWHRKGIHTLEEIVAAEETPSTANNSSGGYAKRPAPKDDSASIAQQNDDILWMQEFLKNHRNDG